MHSADQETFVAAAVGSVLRTGTGWLAMSPRTDHSSAASRLVGCAPARNVARRAVTFFLLLSSALAVRAADLEFRLTDTKTNQPVTDAVISLTALDPPATQASSTPALSSPATSASSAAAEIMQRNEEFSPFVTAIRTGTAIRFPNRDTVQHHVYSLSKPKKFELPLYDPGQAESIVFDQPGVVTVGCNLHDWMLAYIVVLDTPLFAVTPATGISTLRDLSPGRYRAEIWHPRLAKPVTRELTLSAEATSPLSLSLALKPDRRIRRTPDTGPGSYQ